MFDTLKKFFDFCSEENRHKFHVSIVLGVAAAIFGALKIPAIGVIVMAILKGSVEWNDILLSFGIMLLSVLGTYVIKYKSVILQTEAGYGTASDKRVEIAEHMRYMPMGYFNANSIGRIMSVTTNNMENLSDVGTRVVLLVTEGTITTLVITAFVFLFDFRIGLVVLLGLALYFGANALLRKVSRSFSENKVKSDTLLVERVLEYIRGIEEVKAFHLTGKYNKKVEEAVDQNVDANVNMEKSLIPYMTLQNFTAKMTGVAMAVFSVFFYTNDSMTLLNSIMMVICSFLITESLEMAGNYSALLRVVDISVDKANEILNIKPMDIDGEDIEPKNYTIEAKNIDFAYKDKKIIDDVSLTIPEKTTTAIVGPSGSGKTTLCHLLSRFWDVDSGTITLGGRNIKDYSLDSLMKNFSFVFQNVTLFKDTIANNIRFGNPGASMEDVITAAKKARCHDFIMSLPEKYDTVIGESGSTLSGGEKQRISIARAIMKNSPVIVLDEATANVDPENEKELLEAIDELTHNKTIIMIAHRLKTVRDADQIIVVDKGKITDRGTHEELMSRDGIYKSFVEERNKAVSWKI